MTKAQEKAVEKIRRYVEERDLHKRNPNYEIKTFEVKESEQGYDFVEVYCVSGMKDDDGTMAAVCCRVTRQIFIGPRGGLTAYKHEGGTKAKTLKGWTDVMIYGYGH
jgi:hypothetical protein